MKANANQADSDGDMIGDACDKCPSFYSTNNTDSDLDGTGDVCDTNDDADSIADSDGDGVADGKEPQNGPGVVRRRHSLISGER